MWPFDDIGSSLGGELKTMFASGFESLMEAIWKASLWVLKAAFGLADQFSVFTVDTSTGPIAILWPMMLWISGILALGLFFWQLTGTVLRGGRGFVRLIVGPVQYGVALAVSVGLVAAFLAAVDGITEGILSYGLRAENFSDALNASGFLDAGADGVHAVALGFLAINGVFPAALGYTLEMLFREAAILVLIATIPINAAGLLAGTSATFFWRTVRWLVVCGFMKPVLALSLVLGIAISGGSQGFAGLLAGIGVLMISLTCPFVLFRLFAFVDPSSDAGAAFRDNLSSRGFDSYGANNPAALASNTISSALNGGGSGGDGGGASETEDANTSRYDQAAADYADDEMDDSGTGFSMIKQQRAARARDNDTGSSDEDASAGSGGGSSAESDPLTDSATPPTANRGSAVSSSPDRGPSGHDDADDSGSGPGGSSSGGGGGAKSGGAGKGTAAGAEEAAVIV
jgi:hypothetical protein